MTSDLTNKQLWDNRWDTAGLPSPRLLSTRETDRYIRKLLASVPENGKLLELGGAPGRIAQRHYLCRPDIYIDCIDFSPVGIKKTRDLYDRLGIKGEVIEADIRDCPDHYGKYDLVCSYGLIEHFEDIKDVVASHFRFAKKGGAIGVSVPNYAVFPVKSLLNRFSTETIRTHNLGCMDLNVLKDCVIDAGGIDVEIGVIRGAVLPHSAINCNFGGKLYRRFAQGWNAINSIIGLATKDKLFVRLWDHGLYVIAKKS